MATTDKTEVFELTSHGVEKAHDEDPKPQKNEAQPKPKVVYVEDKPLIEKRELSVPKSSTSSTKRGSRRTLGKIIKIE